LVTYVEKNDLVGSEDFSSKFRTARRTIQMPRMVPFEEAEAGAGPPPQVLPKNPHNGMEVDTDVPSGSAGKATWAECSMYMDMHIDGPADADDSVAKYMAETHFGPGEKEYLQERIEAAKEQGETTLTVTRIPTVLFMWDMNDLKRLMLADPKVEKAMSSLLKADITYKLNNASVSALGTRLCGMPTTARGDNDVRMCGPSE
jgi:hypothetical protein